MTDKSKKEGLKMPKSLFSELDYETGLACMDAGDYESASGSFRKAASSGHAGAQFYLGMMYVSGLGLPKNNQEAFWWLEKAAGQNHAGAVNELRVLKKGNETLKEEIDSLPDEDAAPDDSPEKLYHEGIEAEDQGCDRRAIALWKKVLEQNICHVDALDALARAYTREGKHHQAKIYSNMVSKITSQYE